MSSLRSAIEEFVSSDVRDLADAALEEDFEEVTWACRVLEERRLAGLAQIDRRRTYARDGFLSAVSWLAARFREAYSTAAEHVRAARAVENMPATREAMRSGEVSSSALRALVNAREAHPSAFEEAEGMLVDAAESLSSRQLRYAVKYWRQAADSQAAHREAEEQWERRRLSVSATVFGMVRIDGDLDPETGETLITALRAAVDTDLRSNGPGEPRTPAQRRADALGEICRQWLDRGDRPHVGGERPHVTLTVGIDSLRGDPSQPCELATVGPIHPEMARRWVCDASVSRVVLGGASEPLDVGRRTSVVPAAIRRAVILRDRHCRFPGCDRPEAWCDAHHVTHWANGGPTALSNLVLLCRRHHRLIHGPMGFGIAMEDGTPVFRRPDESVLEDRAPP